MPREPLYTDSLRTAKVNNEVDLWRASLKENRRCRDGMDQMISERFDGMHLDGDSIKDLCGEYGIDRVGWILANTIQHHDWDGRFRPQNHEWAGSFPIPAEPEDHAGEYVSNSHSEILNGLTDQYRKYIQSLGLHGTEAIKQSAESQDYTGKLLILKPEILVDEYKNGDFQYFFARTGFGCDPESLGTKVFGEFLLDGEKTHFNRYDFLGVADESKLPDWATKKLQELTILCEQNNNPGMEIGGME